MAGDVVDCAWSRAAGARILLSNSWRNLGRIEMSGQHVEVAVEVSVGQLLIEVPAGVRVIADGGQAVDHHDHQGGRAALE